MRAKMSQVTKCSSSHAALSKRTKSSETFLLSSAALANLTFMEPSVVGLMRRHSTVKVLVAAIRLQRTVSIYIQDQVSPDVQLGRREP